MDGGELALLGLFAAIAYAREWPQKLWRAYRNRRAHKRRERERRKAAIVWQSQEAARLENEKREREEEERRERERLAALERILRPD